MARYVQLQVGELRGRGLGRVNGLCLCCELVSKTTTHIHASMALLRVGPNGKRVVCLCALFLSVVLSTTHSLRHRGTRVELWRSKAEAEDECAHALFILSAYFMLSSPFKKKRFLSTLVPSLQCTTTTKSTKCGKKNQATAHSSLHTEQKNRSSKGVGAQLVTHAELNTATCHFSTQNRTGKKKQKQRDGRQTQRRNRRLVGSCLL